VKGAAMNGIQENRKCEFAQSANQHTGTNPEEEKTCLFCGKQFFRETDYPVYRFLKRSYCSMKCATKSRYDYDIQEKACLFCGKIIKTKDGVCPSAIRRKKFCSRSCSVKYTKNGVFLPGEKHWNWNGGVTIDSNGYRRIRVGKYKYRNEHIIVAEKAIGRPLAKDEVVHHKNGDRLDNHPDNLMVMKNSDHIRLHMTGKKLSEETKQKLKELRKGTNQKENHQQWKKGITKDSIIKALQNHKTKKDVAAHLGIHPDTLRARIKYYNLFKGEKDGE
jgi:hypothetical protein